uniref:Uncharacterized protein n=1 Tax=Arundo donax TaxID=35708 RepID=A0A0A9CBL1_ARUDO
MLQLLCSVMAITRFLILLCEQRIGLVQLCTSSLVVYIATLTKRCSSNYLKCVH